MELKLPQELFGNSMVSVIEHIHFDKMENELYLNTFSALKENGYIVADSFNDPLWTMPCKIKANDFHLVFDLDIYRDLNVAVKAFITLRRSSGVSAHKCYDEVQLLKIAIRFSNGLKQSNKVKDKLVSMSEPRAYSFSNVLKNFISFFPCEQGEELQRICDTVPFATYGNRDLPHFHDVLVFNDIVNDFFQTKPFEETLKYMPIMFWWLITNILPQRPTELLLMNIDCLELRTDGSMGLKVPRIKNESDSPDRVVQYDSIQIDSKTYQLISFYKVKLIQFGIEDDYLFPRDLYQLFRKRPKRQAFNRMTLYNFDVLLQEFYNEVVEGIYSETNIEKIKPGDTRHFAIINMFLQGFNMLSIARMAGHDVIATQDNYYSHAEHFSQSYVFILAQKMLERKISDTMPEGFIGWRRDTYDRGKIYNHHDTLKMVKVDFGYCMERKEIFPSSCVEDCRVCSKYVFKPAIDKYEEGVEWLQNYASVLNQRMNEVHLIMKEHCRSSLLSNHPASDEISKTNSMKLVKCMDQKAIIDSILMEEDRYD
ncbi:hypothetical protein SAMN03159341_1377 [Paenibacillus sp. 1_12]|nr:hypothetical protein [Paenibacillus sp. 1_12]SFM48156.1 hypothetical protein SAMN03159341_1377 [Paenibacillus sp. 1_12]